DQTWVCAESSLSRELAPGLTSGCEDAVLAEQRMGCAAVGVTNPCITLTPCSFQSAGNPLSRELEHVKKELERVKADKTAQCEAYQQTISSLQAQLRAA
ncbi:hypothetical protein N302_09370, partial [Corvus brachyrhynchos]